MKDWRTTLAGLLTGLPFAIDSLLQAYTAGYFTDKTGWTLFGSLAWILVTALVKDSKKIEPKNINATDNELIGDRPNDR